MFPTCPRTAGLMAYGVRAGKTILHVMKNPFTTIVKSLRTAVDKARCVFQRIDAWQRKGVEVAPLSAESHECLNCRTVFTGNFCPRCGQSAGVSRFTFRHALSKTLEVWGLGNRSLPRTLLHLIYRPGYMIGDYLDGRQAPYFPPIKMLFLVTAAFVVTQHIVAPGVMDGIYSDVTISLSDKKLDIPNGEEAYTGKRIFLEGMNNFIDVFENVTDFFRQNQAIELVLSHSLFALIAMWVFRRSPLRPNMNLTECFFSQILIATQLMMVSMACVIATQGSRWMDNMYCMPTWLLLLVMFYDYKQLYGFGLLRTAWYTLKVLAGWWIMMSLLLVVWMALSVLVAAI